MSPERQDLVAVFGDRARAEAVVARARAVGVADSAIRVERSEDEVAALRGEMREELERSWFGPQGGVLLTKRMTRGVLAVSPFTVAAGALLALPLAFVPWGLPLWGRILLVALIGATGGAVVGFVIGGGEAEKGAGGPLAAERGVTVRVADTRPEVQRLLLAAEPLRVDVVAADGTPLRALSRESARTDDGVFEDLARAWREPDRDLPARHEDLSVRRARERERH